MEVADVRKRVRDAIERARRVTADRRSRVDAATHTFDRFLADAAAPLFRQVANVLRTEGYAFTVFTPAGSVRLMSDRRAEDYLELLLNTSGDHPVVIMHVSRAHGRRVDETEHILGDPSALDDETLLTAVLTELEPFVLR